MLEDKDRNFPIKAFLDAKGASGGTFSPNGNEVAYLFRDKNVLQIFLYSEESGKHKQLTNGEEPIFLASFSPVERKILFEQSVGGDENTQLYILDLFDESVTQITTDAGAQYRFGGWSRDGKYITYSANTKDREHFTAFIYSLEKKEEIEIWDSKGWVNALGFSPNGKFVIAKKLHNTRNNDFFLIDIEKKNAVQLTTHEGEASFSSPRWTPDSRGFYFVTDQGKDISAVAFFDLKEMRWEYVLEPDFEVWSIGVSYDGTLLGVMTNENGYAKLQQYHLPNIAPLENMMSHFPEQSCSRFFWSRDSQKLLIGIHDATRPSTLWIGNAHEQKFKQITEIDSVLDHKELVHPTFETYRSFDEREIPTFLYLPKQKSKAPMSVVVLIHGGPEGQSLPIFDPLIQYLVYKGYAVVAPNIRGSSGYGRAYMDLDNIEKRFDAIRDLEFLHKFIAQDKRFDEKKAALIGGSYGGYMVLAGLAFQPHLWTAGVDIVGIADLRTFLKNTSDYRRKLREGEYGFLGKDDEVLQALSPLEKVSQMQAPLFIVHGKNDPRVPLSEAEQIYDAYQETGKEAKMLVFDDEGHGVVKMKNKLILWPQVIEFLEKYIK